MGRVVLYGGESDASHAQESCARLAQEIAALKRYEFHGRFVASESPRQRTYLVPAATIELAIARTLGIQSEHDLFGGVVPHSFVATKVITHPLVAANAYAPPGWSSRFARAVSDVVLAGYAAFTRRDAQLAGKRLLEHGPIRLKHAHGTAGRDQVVIRDSGELAAVIDHIDSEQLATGGVLLEENLADVKTFSVGQVRIDDLTTSYVGTQRLTHDNAGQEVYGGTDLLLARGDYDALLALALGEPEREAIANARVYDAAAHAEYRLFASRRNYDVARGRDARGRERTGVLEQSWRIGGASGLEIAALTEFRADPRTVAVRASSYEIYGTGAEAPAHAKIYFRGEDEKVGRLLKYTVVDEHVAN